METASVNDGPTLEEVKKRFEKWRSSRSTKRELIPEPLLRSAAELCKIHGISHVSRTLRLSYAKLKKQASMIDSVPTPVEFMPLDLGCFSGQWRMECDRPDGAHLKVSGNGPMAEMKHLLDCFLS
jgi:hypothetical protein